MPRASGTERASRSSFGTTRVSPARTAAEGLIEAGPVAVGAGEFMVEVDAILGHTETEQDLAPGGEVLFVEAAPRVTDQGCCRDRVYG